MAELTITLARVAAGEGLVIRVGLRPDEDALPREHEQRHRELVERLLPSLVSGGDGHPGMEVRRERPAREPVVG